jgi:site-specific DNA recombinase
MRKAPPTAPVAKPATRTVAIYCRKSTEEGLDREFNSLDAQRQACEQFAASQRHEGWVVSPDRYDDGGFSGGNTERPALQRLMDDVDAGKIQVIAVYKLDRMSRSLTDFVGLLQRLDAKQVAFVSVTQHFNTATPMGRLMLNILICFAQFERENTIERIRDKVAATKRMGRWCGGNPILGYDVAPGGRKLVVNEAEAERVRAIFDLYRERRSLMATLEEVVGRGWHNKEWTNGAGKQSGGSPFRKSTLAHLLGNITYTGRIRYRDAIYAAEHPAIVDLPVFDEVQRQLASQSRSGGAEARTKHTVLLRGLLMCAPCGCKMTYCYSRRGTKVYGYYTCAASREKGAHSCPMPSLPAAEIERMVVSEIAAICRDPALANRVIVEAGARHDAAVAEAKARLADAEDLAAKAAATAQKRTDDGAHRGILRQAEAQVATLRSALVAAQASDPRTPAARAVLASFDPVWAELNPTERINLLRSLVERIAVDGHAGKLAVTFRASGIADLAKRGVA